MKDRPRLPEMEHQSQAEIDDLRFKRRQAWELNVRRNLCTYNTYIRYARWEEELGELGNARSVFERALEFSRCREPDVWMCYVDMELRHKQFGYALNILDRAVNILPRHDKMWLRYCSVLENLGNIEEVRRVFQRWIAWDPPIHAFLAFVEFEARVKEMRRARSVFERMLIVHPFAESYIKYAEFEIRQHQFDRARAIFERAAKTFKESMDETLLCKFAEFEESQREVERARALYRFGLAQSDSKDLRASYLRFEKRFGGQDQIEDAAFGRQQSQYRAMIEENPHDYNTWFELCQLVEKYETVENVRLTYERAIETIPISRDEKKDWSKYVLICISFAVFEETVAKDIERARKVYNDTLEKIPHEKFTFSRLWTLYAYFEVRQKNLPQARKAFGFAIGKCPRSAIFDAYIEMEMLMENDDRVRILLRRFVDTIPNDVRGWLKFAKFESTHGEIQAARNIFEEAVASGAVDASDLLWASYIDFESNVGSVEQVKTLYRRRLEENNALSLWKGLIMVEADVCGNIEEAREIFSAAESTYSGDKGARKLLREFRVEFEEMFGTDETVAWAQSQLPAVNESGELIFPEESESSASALLAAAESWALGL